MGTDVLFILFLSRYDPYIHCIQAQNVGRLPYLCLLMGFMQIEKAPFTRRRQLIPIQPTLPTDNPVVTTCYF